MYNLLISAAVTLVVFVALALAFSPLAAIIPAVIAFLITNVLLARRVGKLVQDLAQAAQKEIQAQRVEKGIKLLEEGFKYEKWQLLIGPELHANIGILQYMRREFDAAKPHLEKASNRGPAGARAKAMLGCLHFQKKDEAAMKAAFEEAVKAGKKDGLVWSTYAWCLEKLGQRDAALAVLGRAVEANPSDDKLKANQVSLQNDKKLKMKAYGLEWYQFHLERPPMDMGPGGGRRVVFQRR